MLTLTIAVGVIFFCCAFMVTLPKNTWLDNVDIGGKTRAEAVCLVRENIVKTLKDKKLHICANDKVYTYSYPEISFKDNATEMVGKIKKSGTYALTKELFLLGIDEIIGQIYVENYLAPTNAKTTFNATGIPFSYRSERTGVEVDILRLKSDIRKSLSENFEKVTVKFKEVKPDITTAKLKGETKLISNFFTYYDSQNTARANNISLACAHLNGKIIESGQTLSFNDTVGSRTKERGFLDAKIILNGDYVEGIGGGVCQVSTTLYNAALIAGMKVEEYHAHSLKVDYVPLSQDAMVSGRSMDLKIKNISKTPIYVRANATCGTIRIQLYGKQQGEYKVVSELIKELPPPEERTDDNAKIREGKPGYKSRAYIEKRVNGKTERTLIRTDYYKPISRRIHCPS